MPLVITKKCLLPGLTGSAHWPTLGMKNEIDQSDNLALETAHMVTPSVYWHLQKAGLLQWDGKRVTGCLPALLHSLQPLMVVEGEQNCDNELCQGCLATHPSARLLGKSLFMLLCYRLNQGVLRGVLASSKSPAPFAGPVAVAANQAQCETNYTAGVKMPTCFATQGLERGSLPQCICILYSCTTFSSI